MSEAKKTKRRDDDPVRVYPDARVAYWDGGAVAVGRRRIRRCGTVANAEIFAEEKRQEFRRDRGLGPRPQAPLVELMKAMISHLESTGAEPGSVRQYRSNWNVWVPKSIRTTRCCDLTIEHWTEIFDGLASAGAGPGTIAAVARTLGTLMKHGFVRGYFVEEPFGPRTLRREVVKQTAGKATAVGVTKILLEECPEVVDVEKYAAAFEAEYPGYGYRLVMLAFASGLRIGELLALRVEHVDLENAELDVESQLDRYSHWPAVRPPKGGWPRKAIIWSAYLHVAESLVADARAREGEGAGWLFPRMGKLKNWLDKVGRLATAAAEASDWPWTFHWLRHGWASFSLAPESAGGYDLDKKAVSEWLGHQDLSTTLDMYVVRSKKAVTDARRRTARAPGTAGG